jgi:hypothetical protein
LQLLVLPVKGLIEISQIGVIVITILFKILIPMTVSLAIQPVKFAQSYLQIALNVLMGKLLKKNKSKNNKIKNL